MASIEKYINDAHQLFSEIQKREKEAEKCRHMEFTAVRNIQRWVRGFLERKHIARLNQAAVMIQKHWRGYCGRKIYLRVLKDKVEEMFASYYDGMAEKIQRLWRGHMVRSHVYDHNKFRQWLAMVMMKNREIQFDNKSFEKALLEADENSAEKRAKEHVLFILFKIHHLLRTYGTPGVCSLLNTHQLSAVEEQLKELNMFEYIENLHKKREEIRNLYGTPSPVTYPSGVWHRKCAEFWATRVRVGKPSLFAEEKYYEPNVIEEAILRDNTSEKPGMDFSPMEYNDCHLMKTAEPYKDYAESYIPLRDPRPSRFVGSKDFLPVYKCKEAAATYKPFKHGPYKPEISKTDLFIQRFQKECIEKRKKDNK